jgi:hypothetical protein
MRTTANNAAQQKVVRDIADLMAATSIDAVVPHESIRALIPPELQAKPHYNFVTRAKKLLNKELGAMFGTINRTGYKRLPNNVGVQHAIDLSMRRIRRTARNGQTFSGNALAHSNNISPSERRKAFQGIATLGLIEHLTLAKSVRTMPEEPPPERPDGFDWLRDAMQR